MITPDEFESGWDFLADDLGLSGDKTETSAAKAEPPAEKPAPKPATSRPAPKPAPREEEEADFGGGIAESAPHSEGAMFDPGPDAVADEDEEFGAEEPDAESTEDGEGQDGGKRRRRRRRRRKKGPGGPEASEGTVEEAGEETASVEEGEAPGEIESDDDDEEETPSAMEEELEAEAVVQRQEWHVMSWMELVAKLYRPN